MEDGVSCSQVDLCLEDNGGCSHQCSFIPDDKNSDNLVVKCSCPLTHILLSDQKTCDFSNSTSFNDLDDTVYGNYESALDFGDEFNTENDDYGIYDWVDQGPANHITVKLNDTINLSRGDVKRLAKKSLPDSTGGPTIKGTHGNF